MWDISSTVPDSSFLLLFLMLRRDMSMLQKIFPNRRTLALFISGLLVLLLVPALLVIHPGSTAKASGGGGCFPGQSPSVNIFPTTANPGTSINVNGNCFATNATVKIFFQTPSNGVVTVITDPIFGSFFTQLTIPSTYVKGTRYFVHVNSATFSVKVLFTFTKPSLSVFGEYGSTPTFGSQVFVNGTGFAANETVDLVWTDSVSGTTKPIIAGADSSGNLFTTLIMPSFPFGSQLQLVATGRVSGVTASALVHVTPAIIVNPTAGVIGTTVTLNGGGFGSNENVKIVFQNAVVANSHSNAKGAFTTSFIVPSTATPGFGFNSIVASGKTSGAAASASFAVEPNLSISPNQGPAGTFVTVKGSHFTPSGFVTIIFISPFLGGSGASGGSGGGNTFLASFNATSNGTFKVTVQIPQGLLPGNNYFIQAIDNQTGGSNQARFRVQ
jgi:hypothetical protein